MSGSRELFVGPLRQPVGDSDDEEDQQSDEDFDALHEKALRNQRSGVSYSLVFLEHPTFIEAGQVSRG